ncbi:hypothetical protein [Amnibacterium soli]
MLLAAAIAFATLGGASAAQAAPAAGPDALAGAAVAASRTASATLGGIPLPVGAAAHLRVAAAKSAVLPVDETIHVKVAKKRYDIRFTSVGPKTDPTRIRLYAGTHPVQLSVRRLVRIVVHPHGSKATTLATTTTFRRFVVMLTDLQSTPITGEQKRFASRASLVAALSHGLAIGSRELTREYGAVLRLAQMSIDIAQTLAAGLQYRGEHGADADLSGVATTHTTAGSGGYTGSVTLAGTADAFTVAATNTTDESVLSETFGEHSISTAYTVHGKTITSTVTF